MDVTVVIPVLNGADTIGAQLESLLDQDFDGDWEIVVADNGSTDGTRDVVLGFAGREAPVRLVDASAMRSANYARNVGWQAARADKVLFCDADDEVSPNWIGAMSRALGDADAVGGTLEFARLNPHMRDVPPCSSVFKEGATRFSITACVGWRREFLEELGGFDESWVSGSDDIEIALRAAELDVRLAEAPEAIVHKRELPASWALFKQYYRYGRSRARLIKEFPQAQRRGRAKALRHWGRLLLQLVTGGFRDREVIRRLAHNCGRLVGSVQYRVWAL